MLEQESTQGEQTTSNNTVQLETILGMSQQLRNESEKFCQLQVPPAVALDIRMNLPSNHANDTL